MGALDQLVPGSLGEIGSLGGFFAAPGKDQVLVASTDGVGTKLKVAVAAGRHDTVGQDIVNHCVNDVLVAAPAAVFPGLFRHGPLSGACF